MRSLILLPVLLATVRADFTGNGIEDDFPSDYSQEDQIPPSPPPRDDSLMMNHDPILSSEGMAAPPSMFPSPSPLVVFPKQHKEDKTTRTLAEVFSGDAKPSFVRQRIEEWAMKQERTELVSRVLLDMDNRESRTRSTLVLLRTAFRDLDQLIDLAPDARKEKKRIEDIGYAFYPLLSQALQWFRSGVDGHARLSEVVRSIDELDALLFFSDLSAKELKEKLAIWAQRRPAKIDKHLHNGKADLEAKKVSIDVKYTLLLEKILATVLMDSQRDLVEFDSVRLGRAIDFAL